MEALHSLLCRAGCDIRVSLLSVPRRGWLLSALGRQGLSLLRQHTNDGQRSRLRIMKNGVPQGSVLSPMLFNIYISDLPETTSRKYGYADDLAILLRRRSWKEMEEGLTKDMTILVDYLRKWRLQLSVGKTVSAAYHLNNREAKRELDVFVDNKRLVCQQAPKYLGVRLDRMLNFKQHLEEVAGKVTSRVALIRRLAGTTTVQPGEPLPKHCGSPRKPWYSPQLNTVPLSGVEAHT